MGLNCSKFSPLVVLICLITQTSCITLFRAKTTKVIVTSDRPANSVSINSDSSLMKTPAIFPVIRSQMPLALKVTSIESDSTFLIAPKLDNLYYGNLLCFGFWGLVVDAASPKKYCYPRHVHIINKDGGQFELKVYGLTGAESPAHLIRLNFSANEIMSSVFYDGHNYKRFATFGLQAGTDYFFKKDSFIGISGGFGAFYSFIKCPECSGENQFASMFLGRQWKRINLSVGPQVTFSRYHYFPLELYPGQNRDEITKKNRSVSLYAQLDLQIAKNWFIGINYQPQIFNIDSGDYNFQHVAGGGFLKYKFALNRYQLFRRSTVNGIW